MSFAYPTRADAPVLQSISFTIEAGSRVAFVGSSGSGKSSVLALIERLYAPTEGKVPMRRGV